MEVSVRAPKTPLSLSFQISYFVEHDIGYQPYKFQYPGMSGSNFMEGGGGGGSKKPLSVLQRDKKPSAL